MGSPRPKKAATRPENIKKRDTTISRATSGCCIVIIVVSITILCSKLAVELASFTILLVVIAVLFDVVSVDKAIQLIRKD